MDQFEQRLSRQPLRQVPAEWRSGILAGAAAAAPRAVSSPSFLSILNSRLSTVLWPCPQAWAGLAAIWIFIFVANFSMRDDKSAVAEKSPPPSPQMLAELRQQRRMMAELIGSGQTNDAEPPKLMPSPRSQRMEFLTT
ncbi:MAG TPA: hypothetical protein VMH30_12985 [Verrucomicrobiae bacterium]|nr:hypothetical protein [Verrucomicrobiae bacterium]